MQIRNEPSAAAAAAAPQPAREGGLELLCVRGPMLGQRFAVAADGLKVGRAAGNQVIVDEPEVSRNHARFVPDGVGVRLEDSSANGTFVNGKRVQATKLGPDDVIRFGPNAENVWKIAGLPPSAAASDGSGGGTVMERDAAPRIVGTVVASGEEAPLPQARLQLVLDQYAVSDIPLEPPGVTLGRSTEPGHIFIEHPSISNSHAEIKLAANGTASIRDLGSKNGTFVNGQKITQQDLHEGDLIQLGACESHLLLFREGRTRTAILRDVQIRGAVTTIGRDPGANIHLDHPTVSAKHAEIRKQANGLMLVDLDSTNGTFVNGVRIQSKLLEPRDRIAFGAMQLVFDGSQFEQHSDGSRVRLTAGHLRTEARDFNTGKTIVLLDDVSLVIEPCEFVGLLGPSGAGKSTLMNALNGSSPAGHGGVMLNQWDLYRYLPALRAMIGFLPQDDILHKELSVRECLRYAARLRLPDDYSDSEIEKRVTEVIATLELTERADLAITQLSGGQRKRVSLGIELLSKPSILFVDEPTAGQDPRTEMKMMQLFRNIANRGSSVVINTHLLGSFSLLDKVAVLVRGKLAFFGPSSEMLPYFQARRPHEIFDKLQEKPPDQWTKEFRESALFAEYVAPAIAEQTTQKAGQKAAAVKAPKKHSRFRELGTLLSRQFTLKFKDKATVAALLIPAPAIAALMGFMKGNTANDPKSIFMMVLVAIWFGCSASVREIVDETQVYRRERQRDLRMSSYLGSKLIYLVVLAAVQVFMFVGVLTLVGVQDGHFLGILGLMWLMTLEGGMIGLLISAFSSSAEKALYIFPLAMIPQMLLAGMLIPVAALHPFYPSLQQDAQTHSVTMTIEHPPAQLVPAGMGPVLRYGLSPLMVSRWGLEAVAEMYVHDTQDYSYPLMNSVYLTFDKDAPQHGLAFLQVVQRDPTLWAQRQPTPAPGMPMYLGVLGAFIVVMLAGTAIGLKQREGKDAH